VRVTLSGQSAEEVSADAIAVPLCAGLQLQGDAAHLDQTLGGILGEIFGSGEHRGRLHEVLPVPTGGRIGSRRVILYGLGAEPDLDGQRLRFAHHELARAARTYGYRRLAILRAAPLEPEHLGAVVEGAVMGAWERRSRQTSGRPDRSALEELIMVGFGTGREHEAVAAQEVGEATNRTREWVNQPGNQLTPETFARDARRIAEKHGSEIEVLGPAELGAGGYNLLLGVAYGSAQPPRLVRLTHRGMPESAEMLALVGKGVTFDSGGIAIKPAAGMSLMKGDMAGAAAVLAAFDVIAGRDLPLNVMAVLGLTENMLGPAAQRPGDVIQSASGKSVEIVNPDAEGRLILADAITLALRQGATRIIDLATLTGAMVTAVGHGASGAMSNDEDLFALVSRAAERAGDRIWRLPLYPDYRVLLASRIADLKNGEYGEAGAITAAMFIESFVQQRPWVHLDIAASAWNSNDRLTPVPRGPTGAGTRLLIELAEVISRADR
jgi:leucyl aminopeptidase